MVQSDAKNKKVDLFGGCPGWANIGKLTGFIWFILDGKYGF